MGTVVGMVPASECCALVVLLVVIGDLVVEMVCPYVVSV